MSKIKDLSPEQQAEPQAMMEKITAVVANEHHGLALDALLCAFRGYALKFPCCTFAAAVCAGQVAAELMLQVHNAPQAPGQQHLH